MLPCDLRPDHALHEAMRPGGPVGIGLAVLGTVLMLIMHVYSVRKLVPRVRWLGPGLPGCSALREPVEIGVCFGQLAGADEPSQAFGP